MCAADLAPPSLHLLLWHRAVCLNHLVTAQMASGSRSVGTAARNKAGSPMFRSMLRAMRILSHCQLSLVNKQRKFFKARPNKDRSMICPYLFQLSLSSMQSLDLLSLQVDMPHL